MEIPARTPGFPQFHSPATITPLTQKPRREPSCETRICFNWRWAAAALAGEGLPVQRERAAAGPVYRLRQGRELQFQVDCGQEHCPAYDTEERTWRHLNFFQHETYLHARVPRAECPQCGVKTVAVPWARPGSGFTLLFEALVMTLVRQMPVWAASRSWASTTRGCGGSSTTTWARRGRKQTCPECAGRIDETASRRVTTTSACSWIWTGRKAARGARKMATRWRASPRSGRPAAERRPAAEVCIDMSPAFQAGVREDPPRPDHLRQISRDPAAQPGGGPGPAGGAGPAGGTEADALPRVETAVPDRWPTGPAGRPGGSTVEPENGAGVAARESFQDFYDQLPEWAGAYLKRWYFSGHPQPAGAAH